MNSESFGQSIQTVHLALLLKLSQLVFNTLGCTYTIYIYTLRGLCTGKTHCLFNNVHLICRGRLYG